MKWFAGKEVGPDYQSPTSVAQGLFGGAALQDLGIYTPETRITILSGIGFVTYNRFKEKGIESMEDLKANPTWYDLKYTDEDGKEKFILGPADRVKAKQEAEAYFKEELE